MKMLSILAIAVAALLLPSHMQADTLDDAHRAFAESKFSESTQGYEAVLAQQGYSAPVLFDLGNAYYREGSFAQAILAYQQAHWLAPGDADITANLAMAQQKAGITVAEPGWQEKIGGVLSASGWAWIASGAWTLLCASLLARAVLSQRGSLFTLTATASVVVLFAAIIAVVMSSGQLRETVITGKNASALISPFPAAQSVFTPAPGETVKLEKSYDDFLFVTDRAGHSGWINKAQLSPIIPPVTKSAG